MAKVYASSGCFVTRKNNRDYHLIAETFPRLRADGCEFMMYDSWYDDLPDIERVLTASKVLFPVMHVDKQIGEMLSRGETDAAAALFERNCETAARIGAEKLVLHLWGGIPSDFQIQGNMDAYEMLSRIAEKYARALTVENVVCAQRDPMTHMKTLAKRYPDIRFTFDTKMAQFHGQLPLAFAPEWAWLWADRYIAHLHVNDYGGGYMDWRHLAVLHAGEGNVDFSAFFAGLARAAYVGDATVESTSVCEDGSVKIERLNQTLDFVRAGMPG